MTVIHLAVRHVVLVTAVLGSKDADDEGCCAHSLLVVIRPMVLAGAYASHLLPVCRSSPPFASARDTHGAPVHLSQSKGEQTSASNRYQCVSPVAWCLLWALMQ